MSSQAVNTTGYSGYTTASSGNVAANAKLGQIPLRDSSDLTRQLREQIIYGENAAGSTIQPGNSEHKWIMFGNQFRLSYLYGKLKCPTACAGATPEVGGAFNGNGAYAAVPAGATFGGS